MLRKKKHLHLLADFLFLFRIERSVLKNICKTAEQHIRVEVIGKNLFYTNIFLGKNLGGTVSYEWCFLEFQHQLTLIGIDDKHTLARLMLFLMCNGIFSTSKYHKASINFGG